MGASQGKCFKVGGQKYRAIRVIEDQCNGFKIYHVQNRVSSEVLALKRTKGANKRNCPALRELTILKQLPPHPYVLQYRDHKMKDTGPSRIDIAVLFELSLGTLEKAISPRSTPPSLNAALSCFLMITKGINHIHHHGVVHFNLQPSTVHRTNSSSHPPLLKSNNSTTPRPSDLEEKESLVEIENWVWKIGDFGYAVVPSSAWAKKLDPRPLHPFSAPESRSSESLQSSADVFSLGALLYYLLYMKAPFSLEKLEIATQPTDRVKALEPPTLDLPDELPERVKTVLTGTLQWDPQDRMTTDEVLDYLQNVPGSKCDQTNSPSVSSQRQASQVKTVDRIHKKRKLSNPDRPFGNQEAQEIADAVQKAFRCTDRHMYIPPKRKHITRLVIKLWQHLDYEGVLNADGPSCRIWTSITRAEVFKEPLVAFKSVTLIQRLMVQGTKDFLMYSAGEAKTVLKQYEDTWKRRLDLARERKAHPGYLHLLEVIVPYIDYLTTKARFHTEWSEFEGNLAMTAWMYQHYIGEWNRLLLTKWGERSLESITAMLDLATRLVNCGNIILFESGRQLSSKVSSPSKSKADNNNNHALALLIQSPLLPIMMELDAIYHSSSFVLGIIVFLFGQEKCSDLSKKYCEVISSYIQLGKTIRDSKFENVITRSKIPPYPEAPPKVSSLFASEVLPPTSSYPMETDMTERELILSFRSRFIVRQPHSTPPKNNKPPRKPTHVKNRFSNPLLQNNPHKHAHKNINYMPHGRSSLESRLPSPKPETHLLHNFPAENDLTPHLCQLDNISPEDASDESMRLSDSLVAAVHHGHGTKDWVPTSRAQFSGSSNCVHKSPKKGTAGRTYSAPNVFSETEKVHVGGRMKSKPRRLKVLSGKSKRVIEAEDTDGEAQEDAPNNDPSIRIRYEKSAEDGGRSSVESKVLDGAGYLPLIRSSSEEVSPRAPHTPRAFPQSEIKSEPSPPDDHKRDTERTTRSENWAFPGTGTGNPFQDSNSAPPHSPAGNNPFKKTAFSPLNVDSRNLLQHKGSSDEGEEDPWSIAPTEDEHNKHNNPFLMADSSASNSSPSRGNLESVPSDSKRDEHQEDGMSWDELKLGERIGIGGSGEVFIADWTPKNGQRSKVAVKRLLPRKYNKETLLEFRKEIQIFKRLNAYKHPNILSFYGAISTPPNLGLVTELLEMSLFDLLHNTNIRLTWAIKEKMAVGSSDGLSFLHGHSIIHRDLKSANLLLNKNFEVKIMDFGLARIKADHDTMTGQTGTYQWMSPEVIKGQKYTESADIYSLGIIFWEICMEKIPFEGMNGIQASVAVVTRKLRPPLWSKEKKPLIGKVNWTRLIQHCWHQNARKRPNIKQVCDWLSQMTE